MLDLCRRRNKQIQNHENNDEIETVKYPKQKNKISFLINGQKHELPSCHDVTPETSLNTFIRRHAKLQGTKFMCLEAGCGACVVGLRGIHPVTNEFTTWAINSCVFPVYSCHGLEVLTIEGIGNKKDGYHDLQKRLAKFNGTQCGFCSPGMVMNMYSLMEGKKGAVSMDEVENSFSGNICRCTGYRPILDAFKSVAVDATQELKDVCGDIEDLSRNMKCLKTGERCQKDPRICSRKTSVHVTDESGKEWFKAHTIQEILDILQNRNNAKYMLVHGNTAHGVYRRDPDIKIFIDITSVDELHQIQIGSDLVLGGNVSLTETMNALLNAADRSSNFEYCREVWKHLNLVANVPVRNNGTLAGNLSLKHEHNDFPSDIFLLLETVGATLEVMSLNRSTQTLTPRDFLGVDMTDKVITKITMPPLASGEFIFQSYRFIHAKSTETGLVNKDIYDKQTLAKAIKNLQDEISPDWVLPDASPDYRKGLTISLFYKFILNITPIWKQNPTYISGGALLQRPLSSGIQDFDSDRSKWPLNQDVQKLEALIQSSGEAQYLNDIPPQPFELWAAFVVATEIGSTVVGFNTDEAIALPGVEQFVSAKDIPGDNDFMPSGYMFGEYVEEIFCSGKVLFNGQPVGMILADSMELASRAASMVKVQYRNVHRQVNHDSTRRDGKGKGHFENGGQYAFTMETQSCLAVPNEDGGLDVHSASQWISFAQAAISRSLQIPSNAINMYVKRLGGAYGAKTTRASQIACAAALGAHLTNRPVRLVLTIESNMESIGKRHPYTNEYEFDVNRFGKISKLVSNLTEELGCSNGEEQLLLHLTNISRSNCYNADVMQSNTKGILTDAPTNTITRAPGTMESIAVIENIMEHIAKDLKQDPIDVRLANIQQNSPMREMMAKFLFGVNYRIREYRIKAFNLLNRWKKQGIACIPMKFPIEYVGLYHALVSIYQGDGTVAITHGGIEIGQGINTKAAQVAAHILQIPLELVKVKATTDITSPNDAPTAASQTSESVCYAVVEACKTLLTRLKPYQDKNKNWKDAVAAAAAANVSLVAMSTHSKTTSNAYDVYGIAAAEVEVDLLTGNYIFHRVDIWEDVGDSISPGIDVGQAEGAFVMGMGYWLMEHLVYDNQNGKLLTNRTWNYHVPMAKDIPVDFRVHFLRNRPNPAGILRSKAIGEPPLCLAIVCLFALRNALNEARKEAGLSDEYFKFDLPASPENVFLAAGNSVEHFTFK